MATLLWLQGGARSGNTMTFRNAWEPSACDLVADFRKAIFNDITSDYASAKRGDP